MQSGRFVLKSNAILAGQWNVIVKRHLNFRRQKCEELLSRAKEKSAGIKPIKYDYDQLIFFVNGKRITEKSLDPRTSLAVYLRDHLRLTGTKIGCSEGGCGACTVAITDCDPKNGGVRHYSVNACLTPVCAVFGKTVTTIEGIGNLKKLHPVQERLAVAHGTQCGYCTPGFIMAMYSHLMSNPRPTEESIDKAIQGNLCRCTGYRPILEAFYSFVEESGKKHKCSFNESENDNNDPRQTFTKLTNFEGCQKYDRNNEPDYATLLKLEQFTNTSFRLEKDGRTWYQPKDLKELLSLKRQLPHARLISGNSEVGVEIKFFFQVVKDAINVRQIPEFRQYEEDPINGVFIGTGYSLNEMGTLLSSTRAKVPEWQGKNCDSVIRMLHWFAGNHVRNTASIGGNIATASPISDLNPIWQALNAKIVLNSEERGERVVSIDENFFVGYRRTVILPDEVITGIWIPWGKKTDYFRAYKQAQRREDDIAIVTGAYYADVDPNTHVIQNIRISYGGMAPVTKMALNTMDQLRGMKWNNETLEVVLSELQKEMKLSPDVPGGMPQYRLALAQSLFFKFFNHVAEALKVPGFKECDNFTYSGVAFDSKLHSSQIYQDVPLGRSVTDPVGRPLAHCASYLQVTAEARYCDDIYPSDCLYIAIVQSPIACGTLESVDYSEALKVPGVYGYIDHYDVRNDAKLGHFRDTPIFVKNKITYYCQPVAAILADNHDTARLAANMVKVKCTPAKPIVTIDQAIEAGSYLRDKPYLIRSDLAPNYGNYDEVTKDWSKYDYVVEGNIRMGGQEHFYLETSNCVVFPHEGDELEIYSSTQSVDDIQAELSHVLNIPVNKITVKVRRIGGGFGGKESTSTIFVAPAAIAALKFKRPVKFTPERYDDMALSGTRHPYLCRYKFGLTKEGKAQNYDCKMFSNCGHTFDISPGVMHRSLVFADGVYRFPNATFSGMLCKTNLASNTAFRGFGGPQGLFTAETMMVEAAERFGFDINELREKNFYKEGECTPWGMHLHLNAIKRCWTECMELSEYKKRAEDIKRFNRQNTYFKRGIYVIPTKFGIGFGIRHLNQGGAVVNIYRDGTVLVAQGGMEMGQGLFTKLTQITAKCLGIDVSKVFVKETSTDTVPNISPTAASSGSDINGLAIQNACKKINETLEPLKRSYPNLSWQELVEKAYISRIPLFASGHAIIHSEQVDFETGRGAEMFGYCVYGAGCSEVEVDCLTGDHKLLRVDVVMDVGESLNPAIDIGQVEGAFMQGYGLYTMEEIKIRPDGTRLTRGPGTYKIPTANDTPRTFNIKLLKGSKNPGTIFSSKAIGEPPLFLGVSAYFAIREAVKAYREQNGVHGYFQFDAPATPEKIRMFCEDQIIRQIDNLPPPDEYTPWTVVL